MKILIIGTGVIGALNAITLAENNEIAHYVRTNKLKNLHGKSIRYDILDERLPQKDWYTSGSYTFQCVDKIDSDYDLVIVAVNSYQVCNVLREINEQAPNSKYFIMALNWSGVDEIESIIKPEQYVMGYASGGGTYKEGDSLLWGNIGDDILMGSVSESQNELLKVVKKLYVESRVKPEIPANILHAIWLHNISTAPFGVALMKHLNVKEMLADKKLIRVCFDAMQECYQLCKIRGVNLKKYPETKMYSLPFFILYPLLKKNLNGEVAQRYTAHALSALDEMKDNFQQMIDMAHELNVSAPNMDELHSLLQ